MTHIENSDRGITLSKTLAWVMLIGLLTAGISFGTTMGALTGQISVLQAQLQGTAATLTEVRAGLEQSRQERERLAVRIGAIERNEARVDQRLANIEGGVARSEAGLARLLSYFDQERVRP